MNMNTLDDLITVDLGYCEFKYWYRLFSKYSMKSHILELPFDISSNDSSSSSNINLHHEFGVYLKQDGIILPNDHLASQITDTDAFIHKETFEFISSHVSEAMKQFREKDDTSICYFMKTNWSCPSDAKWILTGQCLKCYNLEDMYTVLKASDRVLYDLELLRLRNEAVVASGGVPSPLTIVTRKWANFNPSMEFRCFVRGKELIAICQRECTTCYSFLVTPPEPQLQPAVAPADTGARASTGPELSNAQEDIIDRISEFFESIISPCEAFACDNYTLDVYLDRKDRVWLVDVGLYDLGFLKRSTSSGSGSCSGSGDDVETKRQKEQGDESKLLSFVHFTDPLLFTYAELESIYSKFCELKTNVDSSGNSSGSLEGPYAPPQRQEQQHALEFPVLKVVESKSEVMLSDAGTYKVPLDVYASNDFQSSFMDILASAGQEEGDSSSGDEV